jgi:hypothetical protein
MANNPLIKIVSNPSTNLSDTKKKTPQISRSSSDPNMNTIQSKQATSKTTLSTIHKAGADQNSMLRNESSSKISASIFDIAGILH